MTRVVATSALLLVLAAPAAAATPPTRLAVAFDVPADQAPEYACFMTSQSACAGDDCPGQLALSTLRKLLTATDPAAAGAFRFSAEAIAVGRIAQTLHGTRATDTELAMLALARTADDDCGAEHGLCAPAIALPTDDTTAFVRCGKNELPNGSGRVVFINLAFHPRAIGAGILQISLTGTTATVEFSKAVVAQYVVGQVLGGDYASSPRSDVGRIDRLQLALHPRCSSYIVRLPPRAPTVDVEAVEVVLDGRPAAACTLGRTSGNSFTMMIPYRDDPAAKELRVTTRDALSPSDTVGILEASWLTAAPPRVIQLGYRTVELSWVPHCLMTLPPTGERLPVLGHMLHEVPAADGIIAAPNCPSLTLVAAGTTCVLSSYGFEADPCRYTCTADDRMPAFDLPSPVRLRRYVHKAGAPEVVGEWSDTASYAGQVLTSFVPRAERTLIVAFDRSKWKTRSGDVLEAIEVAIGDSRQRIDLEDDPGAPWFEVSAPGLGCADAIEVRIDGTREYPAGPVPTQAGVLSLDAPRHYRRDRRFGFAIGAAFGLPVHTRSYEEGDEGELWRFPARIEPMLNGAVTLERYVDEPFVGAIEGSLDYHLGRMTYRGVELPGEDVDRATFTWYHRFTAMAKATAWTTQRWHLGGGLGGGFGSPVWRRDIKVVDSYNGFVALQTYARIRSPRSTTLWLELTGDVRIGERRNYFETDFQGQPRLNALRSVDLGVSVRLRFGAS